MKKDLFIDTNIAKNFSNPMDHEYKKLIEWLKEYHEEDIQFKRKKVEEFAHLTVSQKLLVEYQSSSKDNFNHQNIIVLLALLQRQDRLNKKSTLEIKQFKQKHFSKTVEKGLQSNKKDHDHIALILLSDRKMGLSIDDKFCNDVVNFSGFKAEMAKRPKNLNYQ